MEPQPPEPKVDLAGRFCAFDLPQVSVGSAEYESGRTGCTVVHFARGASCELDVRGGSNGIVGDHGFAHAICLAGGSLLGLEAVSGVAAELFERGGRSSDFSAIAAGRSCAAGSIAAAANAGPRSSSARDPTVSHRAGRRRAMVRDHERSG